MSGIKPVIMLTNTNRELNVTGQKIRADHYYAMSDGIHTVQVVFNNFIGGIRLQGTLSLDPEESDWFDIGLTGCHCSNQKIVKYPKDSSNPTGNNGGDSGTDAYTFLGNFSYLRVVVDRTYLGDINPEGSFGSVDRVLLAL